MGTIEYILFAALNFALTGLYYCVGLPLKGIWKLSFAVVPYSFQVSCPNCKSRQMLAYQRRRWRDPYHSNSVPDPEVSEYRKYYCVQCRSRWQWESHQLASSSPMVSIEKIPRRG